MLLLLQFFGGVSSLMKSNRLSLNCDKTKSCAARQVSGHNVNNSTNKACNLMNLYSLDFAVNNFFVKMLKYD